MALASGFSTTLSNPIGIRLVLLGLVVMPTTVLILVFDVDSKSACRVAKEIGKIVRGLV